MRFISAAALADLLSPVEAADALDRGLARRPSHRIDPVPRSIVPLARAGDEAGSADVSDLMLMPSYGDEGIGVKLLTIRRGETSPRAGVPSIQGVYVLFAHDTLSPQLLIDGAALTAHRTAAVSAVATRHLARPDSSRLVVFGAGAQGEAHVAAMRAARPIKQVLIVGATPDSERARRLVARLCESGVDARVAPPSCVSEADIVCTCTTAETPILDDAEIPDGVHINAVGSYRRTMRELPSRLLARGLLVVESEHAALAEAGEITRAIADGVLPASRFAADIASVARGEVTRSADSQITLFKSVGMAIEDLIVAREVARRIAAQADAAASPISDGDGR